MKLTKDTLFSIAIQLELPDLLTFSNSSKKINDIICRQNDIWYYKLNEKFPGYQLIGTPKQTYQTFYYTKLKNDLKFKGTISELLNSTELKLSNNELKEIPKEIASLTNLKELNLYNNQLKEIPKEMASLTNLQFLEYQLKMIN